MAERRGFARPRPHAMRAYALRPVRSRLARLSVVLAWTAAAAALGAGATLWALRHDAFARCQALSPGALRAELADAQFKLEQERAAKAALQKSADSAQAAVASLQADLLFLRSHRGGER
jgi:hypothetical protein